MSSVSHPPVYSANPPSGRSHKKNDPSHPSNDTSSSSSSSSSSSAASASDSWLPEKESDHPPAKFDALDEDDDDLDPLMGNGEAHEGRFRPAPCHDWWAIIAFVIVVLVFCGFGFSYYSRYKDDMQKDSGNQVNTATFILSGICVATGLVLSLIYMVLMQKFAKELIWITMILAVVVAFAGFLICCFIKNIVGIICFLLLTVLSAVYIYFVQDSIPFAVVCLETAVGAVKMYPATIYTAVWGIFMQAGWLFIWLICALSIFYSINIEFDNKGRPDRKQVNARLGGALFGMLIVFFWASQVIKNIVHVTVSGVIATWYFLYPGSVRPNPTWSSFKRATTTSLGSICLGSLVLSIIKAIRATFELMAKWSATEDRGLGTAICICIVDCLLSAIERIVEYINMYAFAQIAIYGKPFFQAAHDTMSLMRRRGLDAVVNDSLVGGVLTWGAILGGLCVALLSAGLAKFVFTVGPVGAWALIGFLIGFALCMVVMEVIESAVVTIFVCLAEDPAALLATKPHIYHALVNPIERQYPDVRLNQGHV